MFINLLKILVFFFLFFFGENVTTTHVKNDYIFPFLEQAYIHGNIYTLVSLRFKKYMSRYEVPAIMRSVIT